MEQDRYKLTFWEKNGMMVLFILGFSILILGILMDVVDFIRGF